MKALEELGKPPLAILENLGPPTEEDFEILNIHERPSKDICAKLHLIFK